MWKNFTVWNHQIRTIFSLWGWGQNILKLSKNFLKIFTTLTKDTDTGTEFNKMYARDKGRFHAADKDGDGALTLIEYTNFKNPLKSEGILSFLIKK